MDADQKNEWKARRKWTLLILMVFVLLGIIGSLFYRYTGGKYTAKDVYHDLGFDAAANVNGDVTVNANLNTNTGVNDAAN